MKFRDYFSLRQIIFSIVLLLIMLLFAVRQSNTTVKVRFGAEMVSINSSKYTMSIQYTDISSAELVALPDAGEKVADGYDDDILRAGVWTNSTWGEYIIVADLDTTTCVKLELNDGRILVFSRKSDKATAEDFETLQTYLK